jgi:hypothetical protein
MQTLVTEVPPAHFSIQQSCSLLLLGCFKVSLGSCKTVSWVSGSQRQISLRITFAFLSGSKSYR